MKKGSLDQLWLKHLSFGKFYKDIRSCEQIHLMALKGVCSGEGPFTWYLCMHIHTIYVYTSIHTHTHMYVHASGQVLKINLNDFYFRTALDV